MQGTDIAAIAAALNLSFPYLSRDDRSYCGSHRGAPGLWARTKLIRVLSGSHWRCSPTLERPFGQTKLARCSRRRSFRKCNLMVSIC